MAGKVKKGFGTYLFILFLALIASFLIVLLVMLFNPFKKIMGYQYFFYEETHREVNVMGGAKDERFDLSSLDEIKINCNYADVELKRTDDVDHNLVEIVNKAKGFASEKADVDFSYNLYYQAGSNNKILCVDIDEPNGGLYFSKYVKVSILIPEDASYNLSNVSINIANTSGNIMVGFAEKNIANISLGGLNIKTKSGDIRLGDSLDKNIADVFIKSDRGNVDVYGDISASNSFGINSTRGTLDFKNIELADGVLSSLKLNSSSFNAKKIIGNVDLEISDGNFDVDVLEGDISGNDAAEQMSSARITIGEASGNVSFPFANKAKIKIDEISNGKLYINGTSGAVNIGELRGYAWIEMTSGSVAVATYNDCEIKTTSGDINLKYKGDAITDKISLTSNKGNIKLGVKEELEFILNVYNASGILRNASNVSVEGFGINFTFPLQIGEGDKEASLKTNGKVDVYFYKEAI